MTKVIVKNEEANIEFTTEIQAKKSLKPGQKVRVEELPDGSLRIRFGYELEDMVGIIDSKGIHATIDDINEAIAEGAAESGLGR